MLYQSDDLIQCRAIWRKGVRMQRVPIPPLWLCHDVADWSIEQNSIVCFDLIKDEPSTLQLCRRYAKPSWECRGLVGIPPTLSQQNAKGSFFVTHTLCVSLGIHSLCQDKLMLLTSPQVLDRAQRPQRLLWSFSHDGQLTTPESLIV